MTHSRTPHQLSSLLREACGGTIQRHRIGPRNSTDRLNHPIEEFILSTLQMDESDAFSLSFSPSTCHRPLPCLLLIPIPLRFAPKVSAAPKPPLRRPTPPLPSLPQSSLLHSFCKTLDPTAASANGDGQHNRRSAVLGPTLSHWHCGPQKCDKRPPSDRAHN